ncbi:MAG: hypothetical protein AAF328_09925 [Planctomycetota bacterium]
MDTSSTPKISAKQKALRAGVVGLLVLAPCYTVLSIMLMMGQGGAAPAPIAAPLLAVVFASQIPIPLTLVLHLAGNEDEAINLICFLISIAINAIIQAIVIDWIIRKIRHGGNPDSSWPDLAEAICNKLKR